MPLLELNREERTPDITTLDQLETTRFGKGKRIISLSEIEAMYERGFKSTIYTIFVHLHYLVREKENFTKSKKRWKQIEFNIAHTTFNLVKFLYKKQDFLKLLKKERRCEKIKFLLHCTFFKQYFHRNIFCFNFHKNVILNKMNAAHPF